MGAFRFVTIFKRAVIGNWTDANKDIRIGRVRNLIAWLKDHWDDDMYMPRFTTTSAFFSKFSMLEARMKKYKEKQVLEKDTGQTRLMSDEEMERKLNVRGVVIKTKDWGMATSPNPEMRNR